MTLKVLSACLVADKQQLALLQTGPGSPGLQAPTARFGEAWSRDWWPNVQSKVRHNVEYVIARGLCLPAVSQGLLRHPMHTCDIAGT